MSKMKTYHFDDYIQETQHEGFDPSPPVANNIIMSAGNDQEMLKITPEGFWVRGVKVEQDDKEAEAVYNAFKKFLVEYELRRSW